MAEDSYGISDGDSGGDLFQTTAELWELSSNGINFTAIWSAACLHFYMTSKAPLSEASIYFKYDYSV